jgi:hypothetical protein
MKIDINITRKDINEGGWFTHVCPEAVAIKKELDRRNIDYAGVRVKHVESHIKSKRCWAEILYATPNPEQEDAAILDVYNTSLHKNNPHLFPWILDYNKTQKGAWAPGYYSQSTTYDGSSKDDLPEISFIIDVPKRILSLKDGLGAKCREAFGEESLWNSHLRQYRVTNISEPLELTAFMEQYKGVADFHLLMPGEYGRLTLPGPHTIFGKTFGTLNKHRVRHENSDPDGEVLCCTNEYKWSTKEFQRHIDRIVSEHKNKNGFRMIIVIRNLAPSPVLDYIEAGLIFIHDELHSYFQLEFEGA